MARSAGGVEYTRLYQNKNAAATADSVFVLFSSQQSGSLAFSPTHTSSVLPEAVKQYDHRFRGRQLQMKGTKIFHNQDFRLDL